MFQMSREVKETILIFLDIFKKTGIMCYMGENVSMVLEELLGVCRHLDAIGAPLDEHVMDILTVLTICCNFYFRDLVCHLKQGVEFDVLHLSSVTM